MLGLLLWIRDQFGARNEAELVAKVTSQWRDEGMNAPGDPEGATSRVFVQTFARMTGKPLAEIQWNPPTSMAEMVTRGVMRRVLLMLPKSAQQQMSSVERCVALPLDLHIDKLFLIDSHCHQERIGLDPVLLAPGVLLQYLVVSLNFPKRWGCLSQFVSQSLRFTVGLHPHVTNEPVSEDVMREQTRMWKMAECVGIGEIGLDYLSPDTDEGRQLVYFRRMLREAPLRLPIVLHCREQDGASRRARDSMLAVLGAEVAPTRTLYVHSFVGNRDDVVVWRAAFPNTYFGIGVKSEFQKSTLQAIGTDRILVESDAPYQLKSSVKLPVVVHQLASALQLGPLAVAEFTRLNACRLYGLSVALW